MFKVVAKQQLTQEGYNVDNMQFFADKRDKKTYPLYHKKSILFVNYWYSKVFYVYLQLK